MKHKNVKNTYIVIHNGTENHFFTVNGSLFFFLRGRKKNSHGSPSNINQHTLSESHAKFGAFILPVTVISLSVMSYTNNSITPLAVQGVCCHQRLCPNPLSQ